MAEYDGSIRIDTQLNTRGFEKSSKNLVSGMKRLGSSLNGIISSIGFGLGIAGLVALGKQAIDTASDIQEVQNVVDTAFGSMAYKMEEFAKTSVKQFGISQLSAKQLGSTFMAMGKSMVGDMETASNMALNLTARAADMASFYNKSVQETSTALKSIYTGETESLKEYGVVMTQVNLQEFARQRGVNKSIQAMTQAEKVQLQYAYVMEQTSLAAGDFAKTSDSWANQTRILSEQFKELLSVIGSGLITVLTPVVKFLNTVLTQLIAIAKQIGAILSKLFGISIPVADSGKFADDLSAAAGGADDLADGIEAAGKAAKGALAPFDELNVLSQNEGGGKGGAGAGGGFEMPGFEMGDMESEKVDTVNEALGRLLDRLREIKDIFMSGFWDGLGDWGNKWEDIKNNASSIKDTLIGIWTDPSVLSSANTWAESTLNMLGTLAGSVASIGLTIAENITGGISIYLDESKDRIREHLVTMFDIGTEVNNMFSELFTSIAFVFEGFASEQGQQLTANIIGIFVGAFDGILEIAAKLARDILNVFIQPFVENKEELRTALEGFLGVLSEVAGTIRRGIEDTFSKLNEVYDEHFKPFFDSVAEGLSQITESFLKFWNENVQPILDKMAQKFDEVMSQHIQPMINKALELLGKVADLLKVLWETILVPLIQWIVDNILPVILPIFEGLYEGILEIFGYIGDAISGLITTFEGIIDFLIGVFTGDWDLAWQGISEIATGIMDQLSGLIKAIMETIKTIFITALNLIKASWEIIFKAVSAFMETITTAIINTITGFMSSAREGITKVLEDIKSKWSGIWGDMKTTVSNIFTEMWSAIKGTINSIIGGVETMANSVVRAVNKIIETINGLEIENPFTGEEIWSPNLKPIPPVSIPRLASGAVIRGGNPFMAILGDQPAGKTNIEAPLSTIEQALENVMSRNEYARESVPVTINLNYDGETFARLSIPDILSELNRRGYDVSVLGVT